MKSTTALTLLALSCSCAQATVSFTIDALNLRTSTGDYMPLGGQILLIADPDGNGFGGPTALDFASGDDVILERWSLSGTGSGGSGSPGIGYFQGATGSILLGGNLNSGDQVRLYWFPTLTSAAVSPGEGTEYGFYWNPNTTPPPPQNGSEPWTVPGDGFSRTLLFLTDDYGGAYPETVGWANSTVAPIPEASNFLFSGLALGICLVRLFRPARPA